MAGTTACIRRVRGRSRERHRAALRIGRDRFAVLIFFALYVIIRGRV
jgi:hypothetical protein